MGVQRAAWAGGPAARVRLRHAWRDAGAHGKTMGKDTGWQRGGVIGGRGCCRGHTLARMGVRPVVVRPDRQRVGGRCMAGCMHQHTLHGGEPSGSSNVIRTRDTRRAARAGLLAQKTVPCVGCGSGTSHLHTIPGPIGQQRWPRADDLRTFLYCFVTS